MCLENVMTKDEQKKFLGTVADTITCWKVVEEDNNGLLQPLHQKINSTSYHAGVNVIRRYFQGMFRKDIPVGAHFFRHRDAAVAVAVLYKRCRKVIRCIINKKDINVVGYTLMTAYSSYRSGEFALTIVAHKATFAKVARKVC